MKVFNLLLKAQAGWRSKLKLSLRQLSRDKSGVTAIEFAAVAPIFFGLLLTIIESGIVFGANQMLENAVYNGSRQVLTGQLQAGLSTGTSQKDTYCLLLKGICKGMSPLLSQATCFADIQIDLKVNPKGTAFSANDLAVPVTATGALDSSKLNRGALGSPGDYMLVRAYYQYPVYVAHLGGGAGASDSGKRLLVGSAAMAIEPFPGTGSPASSGAALVGVTCPPSP